MHLGSLSLRRSWRRQALYRQLGVHRGRHWQRGRKGDVHPGIGTTAAAEHHKEERRDQQRPHDHRRRASDGQDELPLACAFRDLSRPLIGGRSERHAGEGHRVAPVHVQAGGGRHESPDGVCLLVVGHNVAVERDRHR